ncbi:MAG: DUF2461 domain-containing protein [Oscillospiraceae bacterium]|nr:DUF2461 domain-containing protein [Oscillospiraceae bacterium]
MMFKGFTTDTIDFLWGLKLNNEKSWFEEHKDDFKRHLQTPMKELSSDVFERVTAVCKDYGFIQKLSRIYRDARRVRDGRPYHENMWFSLERPSEEWTSVPVFWFDIGTEYWGYGMGFYQARAETMTKFRARIDRDPKKFEKLAAFLDEQDEFKLEGAEYARKKEAPTEKTALWYNRKSVSLNHMQPNGKELFSPELAGRVADGMLSLMPMYDYFVTLDSDGTL